MIVCPKCTRVLMDVLDDGTTRIRTRLLLFGENGQTRALCPQCKGAVALPLKISGITDIEKPQKTQKSIKHVVTKSAAKKTVDF